MAKLLLAASRSTRKTVGSNHLDVRCSRGGGFNTFPDLQFGQKVHAKEFQSPKFRMFLYISIFGAGESEENSASA